MGVTHGDQLLRGAELEDQSDTLRGKPGVLGDAAQFSDADATGAEFGCRSATQAVEHVGGLTEQFQRSPGGRGRQCGRSTECRRRGRRGRQWRRAQIIDAQWRLPADQLRDGGVDLDELAVDARDEARGEQAGTGRAGSASGPASLVIPTLGPIARR